MKARQLRCVPFSVLKDTSVKGPNLQRFRQRSYMNGLKRTRSSDNVCFWIIEAKDLGPGAIDFDVEIGQGSVGFP
jgi:hypothetical protein